MEDVRHYGFEVRRLDHVFARNLEAKVREKGIDELTLMHGWIIRYLIENQDKDIYQKDIEKHCSIGRSTVTNILQLMEKKGLIRREAVPNDARLKKVMLTQKGLESHEGIAENGFAVSKKKKKKKKDRTTDHGTESSDDSGHQ